MRFVFCPLCGKKLGGSEAENTRPACSCGFVHYRNPAPAAAVCLVDQGRCLWVRRAFPPREGQWSLPSGFLEWDEDIRECARRETREETGLDVELGELLGVYSGFDDPRTQAVLAVWLARRLAGEEKAGDDAGALAWFPVDSPPDDIALEVHRRAACDLMDQLGIKPRSD